MSTRTNLIVTIILAIGIVAPVGADTVTHLGNAIDFGDGWRSTNESKATPANSDPDDDDAWGTDGYYTEGLQSLPPYISTVTVLSSGTASGKQPYDDPSQPIGPDVADRNHEWWANNIAEGGNPVTFTITLATAADFVLTVIYDCDSNFGGYGTDEIEVTGPGSFAETTGLTANGTVDYAFFQITGDPGDVFTVVMVGDGTSGTIAAGIGFEAAAAAAATPGTLIYGK